MPQVLHTKVTRCGSCGHISTESQLYDIVEARPGYRHLTPTTINPDFKPEIVRLPDARVAACETCAPTLPDGPAIPVYIGRAPWRIRADAILNGKEPPRDPNDVSYLA